MIESIRDGSLAMEINVETRTMKSSRKSTITMNTEAERVKSRKAEGQYFLSDSVRKSLGERDLDVAIKEQRLLLGDLKEQQVVNSDEQGSQEGLSLLQHPPHQSRMR